MSKKPKIKHIWRNGEIVESYTELKVSGGEPPSVDEVPLLDGDGNPIILSEERVARGPARNADMYEQARERQEG